MNYLQERIAKELAKDQKSQDTAAENMLDGTLAYIDIVENECLEEQNAKKAGEDERSDELKKILVKRRDTLKRLEKEFSHMRSKLNKIL